MLGADASARCQTTGTTDSLWMIAGVEWVFPPHFTSRGCYLLFVPRSAIGSLGTGDSPCTLSSVAIGTKEYDDQRVCFPVDHIVLSDDHATICLQPSRPMGDCGCGDYRWPAAMRDGGRLSRTMEDTADVSGAKRDHHR